MENYLTQRKKRELFTDPEFFDSCRKLSEMVGDREVTVLLAKLYAEQLDINTREGIRRGASNNIPDLMILYLNEINRGVFEGKFTTAQYTAMPKLSHGNVLSKIYRPRMRSLPMSAMQLDEMIQSDV